MALLSSPRARRRALWMGAVAGVVAAVAAAVVALPKASKQKETLRPGGQVVTVDHSTRMTPARRKAVNDLLDAFVPAAMERQEPLRALPLVTGAFRSGVTRREWARGALPVAPYYARGDHFHGWTLNYSYPREISVDLLLHPARKETLGPLAVTAVFKQVHGRWLIDSIVPVASFAPARKPPKLLAQPDFLAQQPSAADRRGGAALSKTWLLVPGSVLALIVLVPTAIAVVRFRQSRRAWRAYERG
jgi:hypothetical protein